MFTAKSTPISKRTCAVVTALLLGFFLLFPADIWAADETSEDVSAFPVTFELEHITADGAEEAVAGEDYTVTLTSEAGYALPDEIEVLVDGELLEEGDDYTYTFRYDGEFDDEDFDDEDFGDEDLDDEEFDDEDLDDDEFDDEDLDDDEFDDEDLDDDEFDDEDLDDEEFDDEEFDDEDLDDEDFDDEDLDDEDLDDEDFDDEDLDDEEFDDEDLDDEDLDDEEFDDEDLDDEEYNDEDFDDEEFDDEEYDDEDSDDEDYYTDYPALLLIYGDAITGPVLIRASADELEYLEDEGVPMSAPEPLSGPPTDKGFDYATVSEAGGAAGPAESADASAAKDHSPKTGDMDTLPSLITMLLSGFCMAIAFYKHRMKQQ